MPAKDTTIPIAYLRECFRVASARLYWRARPRSHFGSDRAWNAWNMKHAGWPAGSLREDGYLIIALRFSGMRSFLLAHRVLFALRNNRWPTDEIDHKSRNPRNNRPSNLREITHAQNLQNTKLSKNNMSGVTGVHKDTRSGRWGVGLMLDGRTVFHKRYNTKVEAIAARKAAERLYHPYAAP